MVRGIGMMGGPGLAMAAAAALAGHGGLLAMATQRQTVERRPRVKRYDAHVLAYDEHRLRERRRLQALEEMRKQAEAGRPYIDAAQEKRNRKAAKRLAGKSA